MKMVGKFLNFNCKQGTEMKQNDIIYMAREAGFEIGSVTGVVYAPAACQSELERFAAIVAVFAAEKEREDCAKLLDEMKECAEELMEHPDYSGRFEYERMLALEDAAEAIRNRGKETK